MTKSIRQIVQDIQTELANGNLEPDRASEILVTLTAVLGNITDEILLRDVEYNKILLGLYDSEKTANRAKIKAEVSPEYIAKQEARNTKEKVIEMIRSLKYYLRTKQEEYNT